MMLEVQLGDKFKLYSENGHTYDIEIVNINYYREPSMIYAADVYDENGNSPDDVMFFGDDFLNKCERA